VDYKGKTILIVVGFLIFSFLFHSSLFFILDKNAPNLYDTDTWYSVRQIQTLGDGGDISQDKLLMYPEGRGINWGNLLPYLLVPFSNNEDTPLQTFNRFAWFAPILSAIFTIVIFLMVSRLYGERVGLYSSLPISIGSWIYLQNCLYGIIDHHLLESVFFTVAILALLLLIKERGLDWGVLFVLSALMLYFTSTLWTLYFCVISIVIVISILYHLWMWNRTVTLLCLPLTIIIPGYIFFTYFYGRFSSLLSWSEPISEIAHTSPLTLLLQYNILLLPIIIGILKVRKSLDELILIVVSTIFLILTIQFTRMGYMLFPMVMILSAYYIDKIIPKKYKLWIVLVFAITAIIFGAVTIIEFANTSKDNQDYGNALQYLLTQPQGLVLSWWNSGHWIVAISNQPPFTDPFQDRLLEASTIFTANKSQGLALLKRYDIHYILVSEDDNRYYDTMVWYSKSKTPYNDSYLKEIISNESYSFKNGKIKIFNV